MQSEQQQQTTITNQQQHRRKTAAQLISSGVSGGVSQMMTTTAASQAQVPQLTINTNNNTFGIGGNGTSIDSRGNQSVSSINASGNANGSGGIQIISRKFIHFAGNNIVNNSSQQTARAATHSQKRQNQQHPLVGILPLNQLINNQNNQLDHSPRDLAAPSSGRSGSGKDHGSAGGHSNDQLKSTRGPLNGRLSLRKSNGVVKVPGSNAVSAPHHQLGYRRQQIMDITEDSNTNSKNRLGIPGVQGINGGNEDTMNSQESDRAENTNIYHCTNVNDSTQPPAYSLFYHTGNPTTSQHQQMTALATSGEAINRFNSKKNIKINQNKLELTSPYSAGFGVGAQANQLSAGGGGAFQFTRKQNLMNADNSLSATRDAANLGGVGVKVIKLKKPQPIKISLHRDSLQSINAPGNNSLGKRRPLIIRKNNYFSGQGGSNERGSQKDVSGTSPLNKTSNFNTLNNINGGLGLGNGANGNSNIRLNNTSSFVGLSSEASLSQTAGQIKNQTTVGGGISHILKTLNQTLPNDDALGLRQKAPSSSTHKLSQLTLKDAKLIRNNMSKKRLDTARKSRLHQIQVTDTHHTADGTSSNSVFQSQINNSLTQPTESRQPNPLSLMMKKKRSLLPKGKNDTQGSDQVHTISSNGGGSLNNMLIHHRPSERGSRRETQRVQHTTAENESHNLPALDPTKLTSKSEERTITNDHSAPMLQQQQSQNQKMLSRGQIMRMQKQKQHLLQANGLFSNQPERNSQIEQNQRSPINGGGLQNSNRNLNSQKSTKSLRGNASGTKDKDHQTQPEGNAKNNSLTRVESKKDLQYVFNHGQQPQFEKHFVKEELVILENIHDSSGTPGDFQFISKQSNNLNLSNTIQQQKILHIQDDQQHQQDQQLKSSQINNIQLNQPSETDYHDSKAYEEDVDHVEIPIQSQHQKPNQPPPIIFHQQSDKKQNAKFGSGQKPNKAFPTIQQKGNPKPEFIPISEEEVTQDTSNTNNQLRLMNSSIAQVKSPIGTTTSFKSQNSAQQAGPNHDQIERFPMRPSKALKLYLNQLTDYEKGEILDYQEIYFVGLQAQKVHGSPKEEFNYGYDDDKGDYKIILKDHIGYRYEVLEFIGKGSFGTALKCFDHKTKENVALKIVKNKKKYAYQAGIELKILNFLKENDPDDIMNVIHMKDYVIFRKHLCISFELLSMNLFEFLKVNDFNGFDHNLIRRFAIQLLYALKYLREFQIIHCDLKPENILLKEANKSGIKIIDFGSSTFLDERVYTYIQSRFYRAPEIMLGIPYTCAIDMWSFGCIMAELYIGYPIFPGESENDQMSRIIEMIDTPQQSVYEISQRRQKFFTENQETGDYEPIMLKNSRGKLRKPGGKPLTLLLGDEDIDFLDFVQKCLEWDPEIRLTPDEALRHIWILKGLPPQVLVHHQRMHNIATPELPISVREARDQFFQEVNMQQQQQTLQQQNNNTSHVDSQAQNQQHSGQAPAQHDGSSQLGGGAASSSGNRFSSGQKSTSIQQQSSSGQQQQQQQQNSNSNQRPAQNQQMGKIIGSQKQNTNIKAETIKSLERAQLKNKLHQLNPNKFQMQHQEVASVKNGLSNITLHSKILAAPPQGLVFNDTHRSDNSGKNLLTSTSNTARTNLQLQLAQIQAHHIHQQQLQKSGGQNPFISSVGATTQQFSTVGSNISPNKGGIMITAGGPALMIGSLAETSVPPQLSSKFSAGFKRRSHQATAVRHQRNNLNLGTGAAAGGHQRVPDAMTH